MDQLLMLSTGSAAMPAKLLLRLPPSGKPYAACSPSPSGKPCAACLLWELEAPAQMGPPPRYLRFANRTTGTISNLMQLDVSSTMACNFQLDATSVELSLGRVGSVQLFSFR
jgi:hypothetical protein